MQAGGEDAGLVLLALDQARPLQPGDGGLDLGLGGAIVGIDAELIVFAEEELARGDDDRLIPEPAPALAQGLEHADEVAMGEPRARREAELGFDVLLVVQQHAARRRAVPPGTPGLLQVVLQRAGDVGVHDEAHVGLVHAHAEGIGRDHHAQRARDEVLLDLPLGPRLEPGVEVLAGPALAVDQLGHGLGVLARGGEDDCTAGVVAECLAQQLDHAGRLLRASHGDDFVFQVGALMPARVQGEVEAQLGLEVLPEVEQ